RPSCRAVARRATVVSPFNASEAEAKEKEPEKPTSSETEKKKKDEKPKLTLTWDNVQEVLDELRPYLKSDGGDCKISEIQDSVVKLELIGACSSCSASSVTMKMGIEKTLKERIPEITEVVAIDQEQEPLTEPGIEEVLNGIRPFLSVSGGSIEIFELVDGEDAKVVLKMVGPPLKSMA
ncbi:NIFU2, partial [Symbiodinium pilosum]